MMQEGIGGAGGGGPGVLQPGDVISDTYRVEEQIQSGGMGAVYRCRSKALNETVALKVVLGQHQHDARVREMFVREAQTLRRISHDAVVRYEATVVHRELLCLVMEFVDGKPLSHYLERGARLSPQSALELARRLGAGLKAAHQVGAAHRDLSPDNVLLPEGEVHLSKIIDFGIAKQLTADQHTIIGDSFAGKVRYASPEQLGLFGRQIDARTDVYSMALVVAEAAGLALPALSDDLTTAVRERRGDLILPPDTPAELRGPLERSLRADPAHRESDILAIWTEAAPQQPPEAKPHIGQHATRPGMAPAPGAGGAPGGPVAGADAVTKRISAGAGGPQHVDVDVGDPSDMSVSQSGRSSMTWVWAGLVFVALVGAGVGVAYSLGLLNLESSQPFRTESRDAREILQFSDRDAMTRADELRAEGGESALNTALIVYTGLARRGFGPAARTIGQMLDPASYDPASSPFSKADAAQAEDWYRRAVDAGDDRARDLLRALRP